MFINPGNRLKHSVLEEIWQPTQSCTDNYNVCIFELPAAPGSPSDSFTTEDSKVNKPPSLFTQGWIQL